RCGLLPVRRAHGESRRAGARDFPQAGAPPGRGGLRSDFHDARRGGRRIPRNSGRSSPGWPARESGGARTAAPCSSIQLVRRAGRPYRIIEGEAMRPGARWVVAAVSLPLAIACRRSLEPRTIPVDRVSCSNCGMLISSVANAAEAVFSDSDPRYYDDVGCMASDRISMREPFDLWVEVDGGTGWKRAREAYFARPADARTPMGYGVLAFSSLEKARARDREGRVWSWQEIQQEGQLRSLNPRTAAGKAGA